MRYLFLIVTVLAVDAVPAAAQIYSWRDAQGQLIVSDKPRADAGEMVTYEVPKARGIRTTRADEEPSRSAAFDEAIEEHATAQGVSPDLVRAVIQAESAFNPQAVSVKGAMGLMQLMPATARELGVQNPFMPDENIRGGVVYLKQLLDRYDQNIELALAAYNAGPGSVERYGNTVPPYRETRDYVKKITRNSGPVAPPGPDPAIFRWTEMVNGQPVVRYGNKPPKGVEATQITGPRK